MRRLLVVLFVLVVASGGLIWARLAGRGTRGPLPVTQGDREIAYIHAATSVSAWERFVTGVHRVGKDWPEFHVDDSRAFLEETTSTPELILSIDGQQGRLLIRWYKLSRDANFADWADRLSRRDPAPIAVIGGGSSDRAVELARSLERQTVWHGDRPLLFLTTATASTIADTDSPAFVDLMQVYPGRSFRLCFTNEQIARAVVDFIMTQPDLTPLGDPTPNLLALAASDGLAWSTLIAVAASESATRPQVTALEWDDDPYSVDLSGQFHRVFHEVGGGRILVRETHGIPFSVGPQFIPNAWEAEVIEHLVPSLGASERGRQVLVLPTTAAPARRVLRAVTGALPLIGRSLVAVTGDSISLNNVYRDADVGWNVRSLAVPVVFFAHQNPVGWDWAAPEEDLTWPPGKVHKSPTPASLEGLPPSALAAPTNTDEVLLHRDLVRLVVRAAYGLSDVHSPLGLTRSADELARRLRDRDPPYFGPNGDRVSGRGEFVLVLRPRFAEIADHGAVGQVLPSATLEVWTRGDTREGGQRTGWRAVRRLILTNDRRYQYEP